MITDKVNTLQDVAKAQHILKTFRGDLKTDEVFMSERDMMAYLNYVRELNPTLDDAVSHKIERFYQKMREMSNSEADSLPVGIRQLEAVIRMSQAHAKLFFRTKVIEADELYSNSLILEVSSPGIDRKFFNKEQYINYLGRVIKVRYRNEQMEYKSVKGFLRGVSKEAIVIEVNNEESFISFEAIEKANLEFAEV